MSQILSDDADADGFDERGDDPNSDLQSGLIKNPAILIVDDDGDDRMLIEKTLRRVDGKERTIVHADSFEAAIDHLSRFCFDVALIDLGLGTESGLELFRRVGGRACETPIILITGLDDRTNDLAAMSAGVLCYLEKQELSPRLLERTIRYTCHTHALEHQLRNTLLDVKESNAAKSDFLARMSHDFRTPLNAILGFSEIIRDQVYGPVGNATYLNYADSIHVSGTLLLELVSDLLDLAKIEAGKVGLRLSSNDVDVVITAAIELAQGVADEHGVTLRQRLAPSAAKQRFDRRALTQMLLNLLSNAINFSDEGSVVEVSVEIDEREFRIAVTDNGAGMTADDIERFLQPFSQRDNMLSSRQSGSGLGLAIVKSLVEMHAGRLDIESEPDVGTTATLVLPVTAPTPERH